jgi:7-cyano-7-deazaguanine reductase
MDAQAQNYTPAHLGRKSSEAVERIDPIPWQGGEVEVSLLCEEFTSLCPVTGQPDFGTIEIVYVPRQAIIESKSLKLYLLKFRQRGIFSEALVDLIAQELWEQVDPKWIRVRGVFNSRGGIGIEAEARRGECD